MINYKFVKKCCNGDITLIENYDEAVSSNIGYVLHHKLGLELKISGKELQERNLYFNRPPEELMFLTKNEHMRIHGYNRTPGNAGVPCSEETKLKISKALKGRPSYERTEENRKLQSERHKGQIPWNTGLTKEQQPTFGKHWKLKFKRGWKINPDTGKREYFIVE